MSASPQAWALSKDSGGREAAAGRRPAVRGGSVRRSTYPCSACLDKPLQVARSGSPVSQLPLNERDPVSAYHESPRVPQPLRPRPDGTGDLVEPRPGAKRCFTALARRGESSAPSPARQTGNLPLHGRRAVAPGDLRQQTPTRQASRAAHARLVHPRSATRPASKSGTGLFRATIWLCPPRAGRSGNQRVISAHRQRGRRHCHHPVDGHRRHQS